MRHAAPWAGGFSDKRIAELASASVADHIGEGRAPFLSCARAQAALRPGLRSRVLSRMTHQPGGDDPTVAGASEAERQARIVGEARWPMAGAVVAAMVLTYLLPADLRIAPRWVLPLIEGVLLLTLVFGDPVAITRRSAPLRALSIVLVAVLVADSLWTTALLIDALLKGGPETNSASALLAAGAIVWASNNIAFALLYWELDSGGAAARAHRLPRHPDLAFPQHMAPELAPAEWRPRFIDYLYLGFTNALAFSPTDTMPLVPWAKVAMAVQSLISLAILGLVVARAVNVFS